MYCALQFVCYYDTALQTLPLGPRPNIYLLKEPLVKIIRILFNFRRVLSILNLRDQAQQVLPPEFYAEHASIFGEVNESLADLGLAA
jgi:hypothetical protein